MVSLTGARTRAGRPGRARAPCLAPLPQAATTLLRPCAHAHVDVPLPASAPCPAPPGARLHRCLPPASPRLASAPRRPLARRRPRTIPPPPACPASVALLRPRWPARPARSASLLSRDAAGCRCSSRAASSSPVAPLLRPRPRATRRPPFTHRPQRPIGRAGAHRPAPVTATRAR
nr:translation initiation factor IF-2-like [Aegilops tauschii subsp. strangulata]